MGRSFVLVAGDWLTIRPESVTTKLVRGARHIAAAIGFGRRLGCPCGHGSLQAGTPVAPGIALAI